MVARFLIFSLIFLCAKCGCTGKGKHLGEIKIKEEQKAYDAYTVGDEVRFQHNNGTIGAFTISNTTARDYIYREGCGDKDYYTYEQIAKALTSPEFDFKIVQSISSFQESLIRFEVGRGNDSFQVNMAQQPTVHEITLNDREYKNVYISEVEYKNADETYFSKIYYTKEYGIIKLELSNGDSYTLI